MDAKSIFELNKKMPEYAQRLVEIAQKMEGDQENIHQLFLEGTEEQAEKETNIIKGLQNHEHVHTYILEKVQYMQEVIKGMCQTKNVNFKNLVKKDRLKFFMPMQPKRFKTHREVLHINEGNGPTGAVLEQLARERGYTIKVKEVDCYSVFSDELASACDVILFTAHSCPD